MANVPLSFATSEREFAGLPPIVLKNRFGEQNLAQTDNSALLARPGTDLVRSFGTGPIRAIYSLPGLFGGAVFVVSGDALYRMEPDGSVVGVGGTIRGSGDVGLAGVGGAGFERLFLADGVLLQVYQGGAHAFGVLTASMNVSAGITISVGGVYYRWDNTAEGGSGTEADPWRVLVGYNLAESLSNMVKAINFT